MKKHKTLMKKYKTLIKKYKTLMKKYKPLMKKYKTLMKKYKTLMKKSKYFQVCLEMNIYLSISSGLVIFLHRFINSIFTLFRRKHILSSHSGVNIKGTVHVISRDPVSTFYLYTGENIKATVRVILSDPVD